MKNTLTKVCLWFVVGTIALLLALAVYFVGESIAIAPKVIIPFLAFVALFCAACNRLSK